MSLDRQDLDLQIRAISKDPFKFPDERIEGLKALKSMIRQDPDFPEHLRTPYVIDISQEIEIIRRRNYR